MKTSRRKSLALAATGVVLATIAMLCWPELQYRQALPKYRFGATAETLEREIGTSIRLRKNGNYLPEDENELTKRRHFSYEARVPRDFMELEFNDFHELIGIAKRTPLAKLGFRDRKLHSMFNLTIQ